MTDRTCGEPGCAKPHRARGLCSTHYNLRSKTQRVKRPIPCAACGTIVFKQPDSSRASVCSISCRYVVQFGRRYADRRQLTRWIPERRTAPPTTVVNSNLGTLTSTRCRSCRAWFVDHCRGKYRPALCCSTTCAKRWQRRHRRKFWVPDWFRLAIYDRDHLDLPTLQAPRRPRPRHARRVGRESRPHHPAGTRRPTHTPEPATHAPPLQLNPKGRADRRHLVHLTQRITPRGRGRAPNAEGRVGEGSRVCD